jgi:hypothetical protein
MISTRLFVPDGIISQDTAGDSLAPKQVLAAGSGEPGESEPTLMVNVPAGAAEATGGEIDPVVGVGDTDSGAAEGAGAVHPTIPVARSMMTNRKRNDQTYIHGRGHANT